MSAASKLSPAAPRLRIRDLVVDFVGADGRRRVLDGLNLDVASGEILALVGESGSGKTVTGLAALGLLDAAARRVRGSISLEGRDLADASAATWRNFRAREVAMVFQDPMTSLNPFLKIGTQLDEVLRRDLERRSRTERRRKAEELLAEMDLPRPKEILRAYPHELSGGMRQRVVIAMAVALEPGLIFADEATTALDVTTQAQVMALFLRLCERRGTALVFVTHDLAAIAGLADRVAVMYAGRIVETAAVESFFAGPAHPYARQLLASQPAGQSAALAEGARLPVISGRHPRPRLVESDDSRSLGSCAFAPRCDLRREGLRCSVERPDFRDLSGGRSVACWADESELKS